MCAAPNLTQSEATRFYKALDYFQAHTEVAQDETTEQVFSRKTDRKAYRQAVLGQRTAKAKRRNSKRETRSLGEEKQTRSASRSR